MKAKRSLTSSFDQLMKRRSSKDDVGLIAAVKENSSPNNIAFYKVSILAKNNYSYKIYIINLSIIFSLNYFLS